jgi:hypothetical protein
MPARPDTLAEPPARGLRWTVHPAAEQRLRTAMLVLAIGLVAALVRSVTGSDVSAALASLLLLASLRAWFLPRTYVLDAAGACERGPLMAPRRLPWSEVRTVSRERHGVHLSPLHRPSRRLADRGLFLRTGDSAGLGAQVADFAGSRRTA